MATYQVFSIKDGSQIGDDVEYEEMINSSVGKVFINSTEYVVKRVVLDLDNLKIKLIVSEYQDSLSH